MTGVKTTGAQAGTAVRGEAETRDGITIAYELWNRDKASPRVALLHPLALDSSFWHPVVAALDGAAQIVAIDCRGHGASDRPQGPYTVELFAGDLVDVMDEIGWDTAVVGGASLGGCVALAFAAAHGDRLDGLALMDTTAWFGPDAEEVWGARADKAEESGMRSLVDFHRSRWFSEAFIKANPEPVRAIMDVFLDNDVEAFRETCLMLGSCDLRDVLSDFEVPASIIVGSEDFAAPVNMATALRDGIEGATLQVIDGARHLAAYEAPDVVAASIRDLIAKIDAG